MILVSRFSVRGWILVSTLLILVASSAPVVQTNDDKLKKDQVMICQRWRWTGPAHEGQVVCVEWVNKDCSQRLHKEICKLRS